MEIHLLLFYHVYYSGHFETQSSEMMMRESK